MLEKEISKAVLVLFPDVRTTGGQSSYKYPLQTIEAFRKATSAALHSYKKRDYKIFATVYKDTDESNISYFYDSSMFNKQIVWDKTFDEIKGNKFNEEYKKFLLGLLPALNLAKKAQIVIGGYHKDRCVPECRNFLKENSFTVLADPRLTDDLPFLLISHKFRGMLHRGMREEHVKQDRLIWERIKEDANS